MAKTHARSPKPVVFVFTLGKNAKVGKRSVPAAYTASACALYREVDKARAAHLEAIPEEPVNDADAEIVFAAIEERIARAHLLHQLSTDAEIDAGKSPAFTVGFHPNAPFGDACQALERGGFTVVQVLDTAVGAAPKHTKAETLESSLRDLFRAIDHASLAGVVAETQRDEELGFHASAAEAIVDEAFATGSAKAFVDGVLRRAEGLAPDACDTLLLLVARVARDAEARRAERIGALLAKLPPPRDPSVKKLLAAFQRDGASAR